MAERQRLRDHFTEAGLKTLLEDALRLAQNLLSPTIPIASAILAAAIAFLTPAYRTLVTYAHSAPFGWWLAILAVIGIVTALATILSVLSRLVRWIWNSRRRQIVLSRMGFKAYARNSTDGGTAIWDELKDAVAQTPDRDLWIVSATGLETFGTNNSPLKRVVWNHRGPVRILLMHPDSPHLPVRARCIGRDPANYRDDLREMVRHIDQWKAEDRRVDYRLYHSHPSWKFIMTANAAWVQYYQRDADVQETPVYLFAPTPKATGMYHMFAMEFLRLWDEAEHAGPRIAGPIPAI